MKYNWEMAGVRENGSKQRFHHCLDHKYVFLKFLSLLHDTNLISHSYIRKFWRFISGIMNPQNAL